MTSTERPKVELTAVMQSAADRLAAEDAARAELETVKRERGSGMDRITECALLNGWFRAKVQNGETRLEPLDVDHVRTLQHIAATITERRQARERAVR